MRTVNKIKITSNDIASQLKQRPTNNLFKGAQAIILILYSAWSILCEFLRNLVFKFLHFILYENVRGFVYLFRLTKNSVNDEEVNSLFDAFKLEFLDGGWEIVICLNRTWWFWAILWGFFFIRWQSPDEVSTYSHLSNCILLIYNCR